MILEIFLIYVMYLIITVLCLYYFQLFSSRNEFSKDDLTSIIPFVRDYFNGLVEEYSLPMILLFLLLSSFAGILLLLVFTNWIINSVLLPAIAYFVFPFIRSHLEKSQVSESDNYYDTIVNLFVRFTDIIIIGFILGAGTSLMYNWASYSSIHFLWFLPNLIACTIIAILALSNTIYE